MTKHPIPLDVFCTVYVLNSCIAVLPRDTHMSLHWSVSLFLCQYYAVLMTVAFTCILGSDNQCFLFIFLFVQDCFGCFYSCLCGCTQMLGLFCSCVSSIVVALMEIRLHLQITSFNFLFRLTVLARTSDAILNNRIEYWITESRHSCIISDLSGKSSSVFPFRIFFFCILFWLCCRVFLLCLYCLRF